MASKYSKKLPGGNSGQQNTDTERQEPVQDPVAIPAVNEEVTQEETVIQDGADAARQDEQQPEQQPSPSLFERLKVWLSGLFRKTPAEDPGTSPADSPDVDDETSLLISEYETVIDRNRNIIEAIRQQPEEAANGLTNIARNLYDLPVMQQYIEQLPPPPAVEVPPMEQEDEEPEPESEQDGNSSVNWKTAVFWILAVLMILISSSAVWQCQSHKEQWQAIGYEKGVRAAKPMFDSLQTVISSWQKKCNRVSEYETQLKALRRANSKAEVAEFFRQYDDYRNMNARIKRLESENRQLRRDNQDWEREYERLRKKANTYVMEYNGIVDELAASRQKSRTKRLQEIPERKSKAVFNTIQSKEDDSPFSPGRR